MTDTRERHEGAHSVTGKRKSPLAWLPWAALLLLLLLAALVFLIVRNVGDEGDDSGVDLQDDPAAAQNATGATTASEPGAAGGAVPDPSAAPTPVTAANAAGGGAPPATGVVLTAGGQSILPVPAGGLGSLVNQPVVGTAVPVESVVADEGFWVGTSTTDRVFVFLTPEARTTTGESPFQVQPGQRVNLTGTLIALPGTPDTLGVEAADGADQLTQQGHLVEVTEIALS